MPLTRLIHSTSEWAPEPVNHTNVSVSSLYYRSTKAMAAIMSELGRRRKQRKTDKGKEHSKLSDPR